MLATDLGMRGLDFASEAPEGVTGKAKEKITINLLILDAHTMNRDLLLQALGRAGRSGKETMRHLHFDMKALGETRQQALKMRNFMKTNELTMSEEFMEVTDQLQKFTIQKAKGEAGEALLNSLEANARFMGLVDKSSSTEFKISSEVLGKLFKEPVKEMIMILTEMKGAECAEVKILEKMLDRLNSGEGESDDIFTAKEYRSPEEIAQNMLNNAIRTAQRLWTEIGTNRKLKEVRSYANKRAAELEIDVTNKKTWDSIEAAKMPEKSLARVPQEGGVEYVISVVKTLASDILPSKATLGAKETAVTVKTKAEALTEAVRKVGGEKAVNRLQEKGVSMDILAQTFIARGNASLAIVPTWISSLAESATDEKGEEKAVFLALGNVLGKAEPTNSIEAVTMIQQLCQDNGADLESVLKKIDPFITSDKITRIKNFSSGDWGKVAAKLPESIQTAVNELLQQPETDFIQVVTLATNLQDYGIAASMSGGVFLDILNSSAPGVQLAGWILENGDAADKQKVQQALPAETITQAVNLTREKGEIEAEMREQQYKLQVGTVSQRKAGKEMRKLDKQLKEKKEALKEAEKGIMSFENLGEEGMADILLPTYSKKERERISEIRSMVAEFFPKNQELQSGFVTGIASADGIFGDIREGEEQEITAVFSQALVKNLLGIQTASDEAAHKIAGQLMTAETQGDVASWAEEQVKNLQQEKDPEEMKAAMSDIDSYQALQFALQPDNVTLKAENNLQKGNYDKAATALAQVEDRTEEQNMVLARAYLANGQAQEAAAMEIAEADLLSSVGVTEDNLAEVNVMATNIDSLVVLAQLYVASGQTDRAQTISTKVAEYTGKDQDVVEMKTVIEKVEAAVQGIDQPEVRTKVEIAQVVRGNIVKQKEEKAELAKLQKKAETSTVARIRLQLKQSGGVTNVIKGLVAQKFAGTRIAKMFETPEGAEKAAQLEVLKHPAVKLGVSVGALSLMGAGVISSGLFTLGALAVGAALGTYSTVKAIRESKRLAGPKELAEGYIQLLLTTNDSQVRETVFAAVGLLVADRNYDRELIGMRTKDNVALAAAFKGLSQADANNAVSYVRALTGVLNALGYSVTQQDMEKMAAVKQSLMELQTGAEKAMEKEMADLRQQMESGQMDQQTAMSRVMQMQMQAEGMSVKQATEILANIDTLSDDRLKALFSQEKEQADKIVFESAVEQGDVDKAMKMADAIEDVSDRVQRYQQIAGKAVEKAGEDQVLLAKAAGVLQQAKDLLIANPQLQNQQASIAAVDAQLFRVHKQQGDWLQVYAYASSEAVGKKSAVEQAGIYAEVAQGLKDSDGKRSDEMLVKLQSLAGQEAVAEEGNTQVQLKLLETLVRMNKPAEANEVFDGIWAQVEQMKTLEGNEAAVLQQLQALVNVYWQEQTIHDAVKLEQIFNECIALEGEDSWANFVNLAVVLRAQRKVAEAIAVLEKAETIVSEENKWNVLRSLGDILSSEGDVEKGMAKLQEAADLAPAEEKWGVLKSIGILHYQLDELVEAKNILLQAQEIAPEERKQEFTGLLARLQRDELEQEQALAEAEGVISREAPTLPVITAPEAPTLPGVTSKAPGATWASEDLAGVAEYVDTIIADKGAQVVSEQQAIDQAAARIRQIEERAPPAEGETAFDVSNVEVLTVDQGSQLGFAQRAGAAGVSNMVYFYGKKVGDKVQIYVTKALWNKIIREGAVALLAERIDHEWQELQNGKTHAQASQALWAFAEKGQPSEFLKFIVDQAVAEGDIDYLHSLISEHPNDPARIFADYVEGKIAFIGKRDLIQKISGQAVFPESVKSQCRVNEAGVLVWEDGRTYESIIQSTHEALVSVRVELEKNTDDFIRFVREKYQLDIDLADIREMALSFEKSGTQKDVYRVVFTLTGGKKMEVLFAALKIEKDVAGVKGKISDIELERLQKLSGSGLVPVYGWESESQGKRQFFEEWIDGDDVHDLIAADQFKEENLVALTRLWVRIAKRMYNLEGNLIYPDDRNEENTKFIVDTEASRVAGKRVYKQDPICVDIGEKFVAFSLRKYLESCYEQYGNIMEMDYLELTQAICAELMDVYTNEEIIALLREPSEVDEEVQGLMPDYGKIDRAMQQMQSVYAEARKDVEVTEEKGLAPVLLPVSMPAPGAVVSFLKPEARAAEPVRQRVDQLLKEKVNTGKVPAEFSGWTLSDGTAVVSGKLSAEKTFRSVVHEGVHTRIYDIARNGTEAERRALSRIMEIILTSKDVQEKFFPNLFADKYYDLQPSVWEEVLADFVENLGLGDAASPVFTHQKLGIEFELTKSGRDKEFVDLLTQLGFLDIAALTIANAEKFGFDPRKIELGARTAKGDYKKVSFVQKTKKMPVSDQVQLAADQAGRDIFQGGLSELGEMPEKPWSGTMVYVLDAPSLIKLGPDGKAQLTMKGLQIAAQARSLRGLEQEIRGRKVEIDVKFAFVNMKDDELPVSEEQIINLLLGQQSELYAGLVRTKQVREDVEKNKLTVLESIKKQIKTEDTVELVFVDNPSNWVAQFMEIVVGAVKAVVLESAIEGVEAQFVQQSLSEAFYLVLNSGGDPRVVEKRVREMLKAKIGDGYEIFMPKQNINGGWSAPPVPRVNVESLEKALATEHSA